MKKNGKVITKDEYVALLEDLVPMDGNSKENLQKTIYDDLGREVNNPTPIFINDPDDLSKPMTLNGKMLRILRNKQSAYLESQIESEEEMNDFGPEETDLTLETPYQVIDMVDPDLLESEEKAAIEPDPEPESEPEPEPPTAE